MILKVYKVKSGQKSVTIPRGCDIKDGDYVFLRKATQWDMAHKIEHQVYWICNACKNGGCSEKLPAKCPYCKGDDVNEISDNYEKQS